MGKRVQIRLFGAFAIRVGDEVVPESAWRLRKAKSLVKLLALAPERRVHRERATELLWPDRAPEAAANNFHQALYVARRALEAAGADASVVLPLRDDMLALYPGGEVDVDIDAFEAAVAHARETGELSDYHAARELHLGPEAIERALAGVTVEVGVQVLDVDLAADALADERDVRADGRAEVHHLGRRP